MKAQKLQRALQAKAKGSPGFRFYALYDKLNREDSLAYAWVLSRSNEGQPAVDGESFQDVEDPDERVAGLNRLLRGWANYFSLETVNPACRVVDRHVKYRLSKWLCWKHKARVEAFHASPTSICTPYRAWKT